MEKVLKIKEVRKIYPNLLEALRGVSLELKPCVFGLLGPNGAGKSSLMEILAGNLDFESGEVLLGDEINLRKNPSKWRRQLGYLPQSIDFQPRLTGWEILKESCLMFGLSPSAMKPRMTAFLERVNLTDAAHREAASYSQGMKRRLGLVLALLHDPTLLLLDEPTAGLDPKERLFFRDLLAEISQEKIVILSSHIVADIERCCSRVGVMTAGEVRFLGAPHDLISDFGGEVWEVECQADAVNEYLNTGRVVSMTNRKDRAVLRLFGESRPCDDAKKVTANMEEAYMRLIGRVPMAGRPTSPVEA